MSQEAKIAALFSAFDLPDQMTGWRANTVGHINETYEITAVGGAHPRYILQHINTTVFPNPEALMENFVRVTRFMQQALRSQGEDARRGTLHPIPTRRGDSFFQTEEGECWRLFPFIEGTVTITQPEHPSQMEQAGQAFGRFQRLLIDFPAKDLHEVIPRFHDTGHRVDAFERAVRENPQDRARDVQAEIDYVRTHAGDACRIMDALDRKSVV